MNIIIDSADYNYSTKFEVHLEAPAKHVNIKTFRIKNIIIPNSVYTVTTLNNTIYFREGEVIYSITIPVGYYNGVNICSTIQALMRATGSYLYTVTISRVTMKITISAPGSNFDLLFGSYNNNPFNMLGYANMDYTGSTSYTAERIFDMSVRYFLLKSKKLVSTLPPNIVRNTYPSNTLMRVINKSNFGELNYVEQDLVINYLNPINLREFDLELCDADNNPLDLNGRSFSLEIEIL